jgi:hypothetical protein
MTLLKTIRHADIGADFPDARSFSTRKGKSPS